MPGQPTQGSGHGLSSGAVWVWPMYLGLQERHVAGVGCKLPTQLAMLSLLLAVVSMPPDGHGWRPEVVLTLPVQVHGLVGQLKIMLPDMYQQPQISLGTGLLGRTRHTCLVIAVNAGSLGTQDCLR